MKQTILTPAQKTMLELAIALGTWFTAYGHQIVTVRKLVALGLLTQEHSRGCTFYGITTKGAIWANRLGLDFSPAVKLH